MDNPPYKEDILKDGFESQTLKLGDDYEGTVTATLIRRLCKSGAEKAILYIHGFNDYFFQSEMAHRFNGEGFNFYAVDLRKYGRSYLTHQKFNDIRNLKDYYEEILQSLNIIHSEGNKEILLFGHSTGGLISTLFAKDHTNSRLFDGLILNSPFYEFNLAKWIKRLLPLVSFIGRFIPKVTIPGGFSEEYGKSIHRLYRGEWEYILDWKPNLAPKINLGWLRAIHKAQSELKKVFYIPKPILILHSAQSVTDIKNLEQVSGRDAILNVNDIERIAHNIKGNVEILSVEGGLHDLILSAENVRNNVYNMIFDWIKLNDL
ncbi:alpha/beta hydrolase [Dysgonomonas termitidis]|uniref:Alpha/beta hydrolase n=1 Tax=Dysgonomonas termitidis TaxID=1516126 RepID=A0ABV9KUE2_9BACT